MTVDTTTSTAAELRAELDAIPDRIREARRAGDVEAWMQLESRDEDLPGLIAAAESAQAHEQLDAARAELAAATGRWEAAAAARDQANKTRTASRTAARGIRDASARADADAVSSKAAAAYQDAVRAADEALHQARLVALAVDELEQRTGTSTRKPPINVTLHDEHPATGQLVTFTAGSVLPLWADVGGDTSHLRDPSNTRAPIPPQPGFGTVMPNPHRGTPLGEPLARTGAPLPDAPEGTSVTPAAGRIAGALGEWESEDLEALGPREA